MAKGYNKMSLAKARAARHRQITTTSSDSKASDCEYTGGVNCDVLDGLGAYYSGSNSAFLGNESLAELEGEELVQNLRTLKAVELTREAANADALTSYGKINTHKTAKEWQRAENVQSLGYNGQSTRTQERRRKNA